MLLDIALDDLSAGGCRLDDPHNRLRLGETVRLYIAGTGPHIAEVMWRQDNRVGLEFQRDLPERVFRKLVSADGDGSRSTYAEDRISGSPRRIL